MLFPAGSSADVTARVLAEGMGKQLGTQIVVVNRPGGGGAVGYQYAVQQAPDGHHLVWNSNSISTTYHTGTLPFDYKSFLPVARVQIETPLLFVRSDAPWKALRDILQHAKANPGKLTVGNSGFGSHTHFQLGVAVQGGRRPGRRTCRSTPRKWCRACSADTSMPWCSCRARSPGYVKAGTVRALVALSGTRDPFFPDVPTAREQGMDVSAELWRGVAVPKGTPPRIVARLEDAIRKTVASPEFVRATEKLLVTPAFLPAAEFGKLIAKEDAEIARTVKALGIRQDSK